MILLEKETQGIKVYNSCPPAKAIGAIGMREDTMADIILYSIYGNRDIIDMYNQNRRKIHFLPFTPEVLLYKELKDERINILNKVRLEYCNQ